MPSATNKILSRMLQPKRVETNSFTKNAMGVKGLFGYLKESSHENFAAYKLHKSRVVFDGNNVAYILYEKSGLLTQFGAEYMAFEVYIERLIAEMRKCAIEPIFVFDGIHDVSSAPYSVNWFSLNVKMTLEVAVICLINRWCVWHNAS